MNKMESNTLESFKEEYGCLPTMEDCFVNSSVWELLGWKNETNGSLEKKTIPHIIAVIYSVVFVVGLLGNCLVMHVIIRHTKKKTSTNIYIFNLVLVDVLINATLPFWIAYFLLDNWPFSAIGCKIFLCIDMCNALVRVFTITIMTVDLYVAVCHPDLNSHASVKAMVVIVFIWVLSLLLDIPIFIFADTATYSDETVCVLHLSSYMSTVMDIFQLVVGFAIPMLIMSVCYCLIVLRLNSIQILPGLNEEDSKMRQVTQLVMVVVCVFAICWTPNYITILGRMFPVASYSSTFVTIMVFCMVLTYTNSCLNPIIYIFLDENFKRYVKNFCFSAKLNEDKISERKNVPGSADAVALETPDQTCNFLTTVELS
ncbi:delta-type opioid receptor-like [Thalassophryne amazonica]|uniref:delta-type opioid receptor-like n=1 Tax=Thalassophryne amazonica TaxID=390379 RepID=UPI00147127A1|nr:delta-type opioid receptor-like [Thalassophryne amazonica]